jgi:high affinity sulfate transporter 1
LRIRDRIPLFATLTEYQRGWLRKDLLAGLSVAAVQIPFAVAYAQLAGFPPIIGLYASILPLAAYALFGSSRQLVVGPDSATCAVIGATLLPLAAGDPQRFLDVSIATTFIASGVCFIAAILRLGFVADFLSIPILIGFLNGVALNIIASQLGRLLGFSVTQGTFWQMIAQVAGGLRQYHPLATALGFGLLIAGFVLVRLAPRIPAALVLVIAGGLTAYVFGWHQQGVTVLGDLPSGFQLPRFPTYLAGEWEPLLTGALGILLVSYCNLSLASRSFARQGKYDIDANQDLFALGVANLCSALSRGFVVSSSDSQTAVGVAAGAKTQIANLTAALVMALVLLFATGLLKYVPETALAAVLIGAAIRLFDRRTLGRLYRVSRSEFWLSVIATCGVLTIGILRGILLAVILTLARLLSQISRPNDAILGKVPGLDGFNDIAGHDDAETVPNLLIYRFDAPVLFFNADYFKTRLRERLNAEPGKIRCVLLDLETMHIMDYTGAEALEDIRRTLAADGIRLKIARVRSRVRRLLERNGTIEKIGSANLFPSIRSGVESFEEEERGERKT